MNAVKVETGLGEVLELLAEEVVGVGVRSHDGSVDGWDMRYAV